MKHIALLATFLILISCNPTTKESISKNHEWLRSQNRETLQSVKMRIEFSQTKNDDLKILEQMKDYQALTNELLDDLDLKTRKNVLNKINQHLDTLIPPNVGIRFPYKDFISLNEESSLNEFRTAIAIVEDQTFQVYYSQIGMRDMIFDSLDIHFIPEFSQRNNNQNVTGKLMFAATNSELEHYAKLYINGREVEILNGYGLVNIPLSELSEDRTFTARIVGKNSDLDISKKVETGN